MKRDRKRLGPCELQDPVWAKMSALAAGCSKKRKKSENKPQAQINKCNNEKRRREQENVYIEELAELISANFADMSSLSVKPDKCAILQEAVNQIRSIKQQESASQAADPVQQGEVSSSRPTILSNEVYGPLLLEALEGFLFVVNSEGKIEHVTENVSNYIKFSREDVLGESIYNFIHLGDHAKFHSNLLPMTIDWGNEQSISNKSKSIDIRLLVKPPDDLDETVEEKQQRVSRYELMHISSTQLRDHLSVSEEDGSDSGPCLLCVASRISHRDKATCSIEQFTTKLDTSGKIICVDTSGVSDSIAQYIKKELKNRGLREVVPPSEVQKVNVHLRETLSTGQSTSHIFKLQVGPERFVQIQTKSKLFRTNPHAANESDFIMSTHSIIGENDAGGRPTDPGGGSSSSTGVGGPLMTSVVNGSRNGPPTSSVTDTTTSSSSSLLQSNPTYGSFNLENEFNFEIFPSSTWGELDSGNWQDARPDSRQSVSPVSTATPRPPSNASYTNAPAVTNPPTPVNQYPRFSFSPINGQASYQMEEEDSKAHVLEEASVLTESKRLRNLLEKPADSKDRILKELLNQDEDRNETRCSPRGPTHRDSLPGPSKANTSSTSTGNNMLRQLLNDKNDEDDDVESRAGVKKKSELLQQLLKPERDSEEDKKADLRCHDDSLMRSLGFPSSPNGDGSRKRPNDDRDDGPNKRTSDGQQVTSSLRERNKMLASLLAKKPSNHQPIPPIPESILTATPHEKLPRVTDPNKSIQMIMNQPNATNSRATVNRLPGRPTHTNYLSSVLSSANSIQRTEMRQMNQINSSCYTSASSSTENNNLGWDNNNVHTSADPLLSELLDQVIDFVPEDIMHLLDGAGNQPPLNYHPMNEAVAINNIQKSLMLCESAVKSPLSPISMPATPPAYSAANLPNQNNSSLAFPPPPNYPQAKFQRAQMRSGTVQQQQFAGHINNQMLLRKQQLLQQQQQQQEQKRRLLHQQKQQQLLIPSNAAANEINTMQNIDSLLNNTVAPNVSLQRSSSVSEPQLSPSFGGQLNQQTPRVGSQQPYSPHSQLTTSPLSQQNFPQSTVGSFQNQSARLSPQSQFTSQLSPRQTYPQGSNQTANWQQTQARLSVQQNPMLSAQLTRPPQQQQRSLNSPGSVPTRHSPYPSDQFPPPSSPNSAFNSQYLRLQRANSVPTATTQLPGGLGSPRSYTGREHHPHPYSSIQPHHTVPQMMYQQDSQYCYDQTGLSLAYNGADRGRAAPHLQPGVSGTGPTSEFVRQELRAVVGARTAQSQPSTGRPPSQMITQQQVNDLESLGISFELSGASDSPKLWGAMGSDIGSMSPQPATSRTTMEEGRLTDQKSSLLQKLLSE
ncbi:basic helix-loop-helix family member taiman isoform X4 [Leptinotarsa decemlineata]|uniref:basic helix-loop-helix family member taiman isoform X4 n=1 Tax=Leptinotarsa decemlineata TaxID=7539 RepID=UPI003D3042EA